ncbi:MAG: 3-isopropylmalate dehydrogenase, partial [Firmicutes bacterium]|nr:3-isopropylmalate dehydrogenase [Bacillota bacterium]
MSRIAVLPGDGIGVEVTREAVKILRAASETYSFHLDFEEALVGGCAIDAVGCPLPEDTLYLCRRSDAILFGAVGGPRWDHLPPAQRPEVGALLPLRKELGLYANLRPVRMDPALVGSSPLKESAVLGVDLVVLRELTGGLYFGPRGREDTPSGRRVFDTLVYTDGEIER